ncbi:hypothetical protein [Granulimonas faecalis]|uniref:hypothetical protein n=1 Tax=Granulimonas faecalis TaxID=2894155 RepID=UPI0035142F5D
MDRQGIVEWVRDRLDRLNPVPSRLRPLRLAWGAALVAATAVMVSGFVWYPLVRAAAGGLAADRVFSTVCEVFFCVSVATLVARPLFKRLS